MLEFAFGCFGCFFTRTSIPGWEGLLGSADISARGRSGPTGILSSMVELLGRLLCLTASSVLSVLMRCVVLAGVTGESCSAISRMLGASLEQKQVLAFLGLAHSTFERAFCVSSGASAVLR